MNEGRIGGRRSAQILAMACQATGLIDRSARILLVVTGNEHPGPGDVIGVDVENAFDGIDCRSAPLGTAVESRKHYGWSTDGERQEQAVATECAELLQSPSMRRRRAFRQQLLAQALAGEGLG